jgi:3-oxoacyl-[acyl-carrier protein] reductase
MRFRDKVAVITGATRGIGRAIAVRFAGEGAAVFMNYQQDAVAANELVEMIRQTGGRAVAIQADSADPEDTARFFAELSKAAPHIDILVNNVGTASTKPQPLGTVDLEEYDRIFNLNTRGLFFTSQEALKSMLDGGRIVNISSVASHLTAPGRSVYAGTKGAIEAFTRVWAAELGIRRITVNSVSPGMVETERLKKNLPPEVRERFIRDTPLARIGQPDDIADIVIFLCSEEGRWLTAQNIIASGGLG